MTTAPEILDSAGSRPHGETAENDSLDRLGWLPFTLTLDLPLVNFTIGDLLKLTQGMIVETACHQSSDLPLRVNGRMMGWIEFEVVGEHLAVRLTDLA